MECDNNLVMFKAIAHLQVTVGYQTLTLIFVLA